MGAGHLAVVVAPYFERADALAKSVHGKALFISVDQDGLCGGLQIFLANDDRILRDVVFNVGGFVAQPRSLVWVGVRWKHVKENAPICFSVLRSLQNTAPGHSRSRGHRAMCERGTIRESVNESRLSSVGRRCVSLSTRYDGSKCPDRWQRRNDEGESMGSVARDLDLTETALRECVIERVPIARMT
jgi:hypothetical protein